MEKIPKGCTPTVFFIMLVTIVMLFLGVSQNRDMYSKVVDKDIIDSGAEKYVVTKIDGCEYIRVSYYNNSTYIHKGNCNNPVHVYQGK